jgi:transcriptional regulator with XRE-family HTH domain
MERGNRPIPNTLRLHRKTLGYKQKQVAALLGLHDAVPLSLWEKGALLPSTKNLIKLSLLYRAHPSELYADVFRLLREELRIRELEQFKRT